MPLLTTAISIIAIIALVIIGVKLFKRVLEVAILGLVLLGILWYLGFLAI